MAPVSDGGIVARDHRPLSARAFHWRWADIWGVRGLLSAVILAFVSPCAAIAQSTVWDPMLADSHWYVPAENLLAYAAGPEMLARPLPVRDQTVWSIGPADHGVFSGTSTTWLWAAGSGTSLPSMRMSGVVTDDGRIRIVFAGTDQSDQIVGIGNVRSVGGTNLMQMQMMSGSDDGYLTHWAFMAPFDPASLSPPTVPPPDALISQEWNWTQGSTWRFESRDLFGTSGPGTFRIAAYRNGYFWGEGAGPAGSDVDLFTELGSITPEGDVLFAVMIDGTVTRLTGTITGSSSDGWMRLRSYEDPAVSLTATARVLLRDVPEIAGETAPAAIAVLLAAGQLAMQRGRSGRPIARRGEAITRDGPVDMASRDA